MQNLSLGNAKALALANAVTADPVGIDSIHFNPAGLMKIRKSQYHINFVAGTLSSTTRFGSRSSEFTDLMQSSPLYKESTQSAFEDPVENTTSETKGTLAYIPYLGVIKAPAMIAATGGVAVKIPDRDLVFATAVYSPMAGGYYRDKDDGGRFEAQELGVTKLTYFSPTVAFEPIDDVYVGISLGLSAVGAHLVLPFRLPNAAIITLQQFGDKVEEDQCNDNPIYSVLCNSFGPYDQIVDVELNYASAVAPSFNLGLLWDLTEWFTFGAVYRSTTASTWKGTYSASYSDAYRKMMAPIGGIIEPLGVSNGNKDDNGKSEIETAIPADYALGFSLKILPELKLNVDRHWALDSSWDNVNIKVDPPIGFLKFAQYLDPVRIKNSEIVLPVEFQNSVNWAAGIEYQWDDQLALRMGFEPRESSVKKDKRNIIVPLDSANTYSVGFEYKVSSESTIDGVFSYTRSIYTISNAPGEQSKLFNYYDDPRHIIINPYAGLSAKVDTRAFVAAIGFTETF